MEKNGRGNYRDLFKAHLNNLADFKEMVDNYTDPAMLSFLPGKVKKYTLFWLGFVIYTVAYTTGYCNVFDDRFWNPIQAIGLLLCLPAAANLIQFRIENVYLKILYVFYYGWLCFILIRGFTVSGSFIRLMIFDGWTGIFLYFVPLVMLFPRSIYYLKKLFDVILLLGLIYLAYSLLFFKTLIDSDSENVTSKLMVEYCSKNLAIPCGFILLTYIYHSNMRKMIALMVLVVTFVLALIRARRGLAFMALCPLLIAYVIYVYNNRRKFIIVFGSLLALALVTFYAIRLYSKNKEGIFSLITERADLDTRSDVELCFYGDMQTKDWIIGKGVAGEYYCPGAEDNDYLIYRTQIETDYLNIILKGGLISLGLLLMMAVPAIFMGLFMSRNLLSKAAAVWILLWLIDLYPATVTTFTLNYILVWISIGICYSGAIRRLPEASIKQLFLTPNTIIDEE